MRRSRGVWINGRGGETSAAILGWGVVASCPCMWRIEVRTSARREDGRRPGLRGREGLARDYRNNALNNHSPRQFKLFADGARPVAARKRPQAPQPNEANLQAKLDAARKRLHEIVILRFGGTSTC
jgi:hypothetical protein